MDIFEYMRSSNMEKDSPLASRLRPTTLEEVAGQRHIIGKDKLLYRAIKADKLGSLIFYGPPGTGKTTLAKKLCEKYKLMYNHVTSKDPNNYEYYLTTMKIDNTLWDRHLLGEMIYPTVYNRKGNLDLDIKQIESNSRLFHL